MTRHWWSHVRSEPKTRIWAFAHILEGATIGKSCNIGDHCFIEADVSIGDDVVIKNGVSVWAGVKIEDRVFLGPQRGLHQCVEGRGPKFSRRPGGEP